MGAKVQCWPSAEASSAAMRSACSMAARFQEAACASGIGKIVLYPWMTSNPKSRGGFLQDALVVEIRMAQDAAYLSGADLIQQVVFIYRRAGADIAGHLIELADFFLQRHVSKQRLHALLDIVGGGLGCGRERPADTKRRQGAG
jgi:hypothetical protein